MLYDTKEKRKRRLENIEELLKTCPKSLLRDILEKEQEELRKIKSDELTERLKNLTDEERKEMNRKLGMLWNAAGLR